MIYHLVILVRARILNIFFIMCLHANNSISGARYEVRATSNERPLYGLVKLIIGWVVSQNHL